MSTEPATIFANFILAAFIKHGIASATLTFSGSGDSGQYDDPDVTLRATEDPKKLRAIETAAARDIRSSLALLGIPSGNTDTLSDVLGDFFESHINNKLGNWYDNEGGGGEVVFDAENLEVTYSVRYNESTTVDGPTGQVQLESPALESLFNKPTTTTFLAILNLLRKEGFVQVQVSLSDPESVSEIAFLREKPTKATLFNSDQLEENLDQQLMTALLHGNQAPIPKGDWENISVLLCSLFDGTCSAFEPEENWNGEEGGYCDLTIDLEKGDLRFSVKQYQTISTDPDGGAIEVTLEPPEEKNSDARVPSQAA